MSLIRAAILTIRLPGFWVAQFFCKGQFATTVPLYVLACGGLNFSVKLKTETAEETSYHHHAQPTQMTDRISPTEVAPAVLPTRRSKRASQRKNIARKPLTKITAREGTIEHLEQSGEYHPVDAGSEALSKILESETNNDHSSQKEEEEHTEKKKIQILIESDHKHFKFVVHPYSKFRRAWDVFTVIYVLYLCWKIPVGTCTFLFIFLTYPSFPFLLIGIIIQHRLSTSNTSWISGLRATLF
jgi:hypothetical protein